MTRDDIDWQGAMPALTTPFRADGAVDDAGFAANLDRLLLAGSTGAVVAGCTGEFWAMTVAEKAALARVAVETAAGRGPIILGAAAIRVEEVAELSHAGREAGCAAVLVTPPYFVRTTETETIRHYEAVAARTALPIVVYNIPGNAGNNISPFIADELADIDQIVAIKESSGDWTLFHAILTAVRDRIRVYCGPSSVFGVPATLAGADGLIDCFPNVWTGCLDLWSATKAGRMDEAWALQATGQALTRLFTSEGRTLYPATKAVMDYLDLPGGGAPRPPLQPLEGRALEGLLRGVDALLPAPVPAA